MRRGGLVFLFFCWWCGLCRCGLEVAAAQTLMEQDRVELKRRQVPREVRRNARIAYPFHVRKFWAKVDTLYSVQAISLHHETAYFDSTGEWLRAYRPVRPAELPYRTYLFLKKEFGVYRVLWAYQVQQCDDLAYYSIEMQHKRINSLKTFLEFNFFGDLTMLDGEPVGGEGTSEASDTEVISRERLVELYPDVYDPEAEEAAYAEEAMRTAGEASGVAAEVGVADTTDAAGVPDTLAVSDMLAETDTVRILDTLVSADTLVAMDTVAVIGTVLPAGILAVYDTVQIVGLIEPADTVQITVADTLLFEPMTVGDTVTSAPVPDTAAPVDAEATPVTVDTVAVSDTVQGVGQIEPVDTVQTAVADTSVRDVVPDAPVLSDTVQTDSADAVGPVDTGFVTDTSMTVAAKDSATVPFIDTLATPADTAATSDMVQTTDTLVSVGTVAATDSPVAPPADTLVPADSLPVCPEIVAKNFRKRFPNAEKIIWHSQDGQYIATFSQFGKAVAAAFRGDGVQVYTAYAFSRKELPLPIERYLQTSAAKMKMTEGWRVVHESKYKRMFPTAERPKDYYYVIMGKKVPKSKHWRYIRYTFNQNAQFESQETYEQPSGK